MNLTSSIPHRQASCPARHTPDLLSRETAEAIRLREAAARFLRQCRCGCCGSSDPMHDEAACKQAAYAGFDAWRDEQMDAGLWSEDEEDAAVYAEETEYSTLSAADERMRFVCPSLGLY